MNKIIKYIFFVYLQTGLACGQNISHHVLKKDAMNTRNMNIQTIITLQVEDDKLTVNYSIKNEEKHAIYLTDIYLKRTANTMSVAEDILPVFMDYDTLDLRAKLVTANPGIASAAPPSTYATKVLSGEMYTGRFVLPVPVSIINRSMETVPDNDIIVRKVLFELGIVPDDKLLNAVEQEIDGKKVYLLNQQAWYLQTVISKDFKGLKIPVSIKNH